MTTLCLADLNHCANDALTTHEPTPRPGIDADSVRRVVGNYAREIHCTDSNVRAAINHAFAQGPNTMDAVKMGRARADQLRARQPLFTPPSAAA
jgi:hypothetical protein